MKAFVLADDAGGQEPPWQLAGVRVLVAEPEANIARRVIHESTHRR